MRKLQTHYIGKVGKIYVKTLTNADEWYQILTPTQAKGIRGFKIKSRMTFNSSGGLTSGQRPFDYAFVESPEAGDTAAGDGFYSNSGAGSGDEGGPSNGLWARSAVAGTVIEVLVYE